MLFDIIIILLKNRKIIHFQFNIFLNIKANLKDKINKKFNL